MSQVLNSPEWPRPYPNGMECAWHIQAPEGQLISLTVNLKSPNSRKFEKVKVEELDLEPDRDFLSIYDGRHPSAPLLARISGKQVITEKYGQK